MSQDMKSQPTFQRGAPVKSLRAVRGASARFLRSDRARTGMRKSYSLMVQKELPDFSCSRVLLRRINDCPSGQYFAFPPRFEACYAADVWHKDFKLAGTGLP